MLVHLILAGADVRRSPSEDTPGRGTGYAGGSGTGFSNGPWRGASTGRGKAPGKGNSLGIGFAFYKMPKPEEILLWFAQSSKWHISGVNPKIPSNCPNSDS